MLQNLSPYAVLCMSKRPQEPRLSYSYAMPSAVSTSSPIDPPVQPSHSMPEYSPSSPPPRRTHYISDIQNHHLRAAKHAHQLSSPIF